MKDISPELLRDIQDTYSKLLEENSVIAGIKKKIESKTINYNDAFEYAGQAGEAYAAAFKKVLNSEALPDGKMYWNIAQSVVKPTLEDMYDKVADVAQITQKQLNEAANIGIKALRVTNKEDRIEGLLNRLASEETYDDISWILDRPVVTMAQSVIDDSVKINSEFQYKAGMKPKIIRTAAGGCCKWCTARAGIFIYPDVPKDIYRRHENCNCTVVYNPGEGKKYQNVWSKEWKNVGEHDKINNRRELEQSLNRETGFVNQLVKHPKMLQAYTPVGLKQAFINAGYDVKPLGKGQLKGIPFEEGGGYRVLYGGDGYFQYHPKEASHHNGKYYKTANGRDGIRRYNMNGDETDENGKVIK